MAKNRDVFPQQPSLGMLQSFLTRLEVVGHSCFVGFFLRIVRIASACVLSCSDLQICACQSFPLNFSHRGVLITGSCICFLMSFSFKVRALGFALTCVPLSREAVVN